MILRTACRMSYSLGGVAILCAAAAAAQGAGEPRWPSPQARTVHSGLVIINGRYIPRPYTVSWNDDGIYINGHLFYESPPATARSSTEGFHWAEVPAGGVRSSANPERTGGVYFAHPGGGPERFNRRGGATRATRLAQHLSANALLVRWPDGVTRRVWQPEALDVVDVLLREQTPAEKAEALFELVPGADDPHWTELTRTFTVTDAILQQVLPEVENRRRIRQENERVHRRVIRGSFLSSGTVLYAINVGGMLLVVVSFGTVLSYRPRRRVRWSQVDRTGRGCRSVLRHVSLILVLSGFDLACTLLAQQSGAFRELNPVGIHLLGANALSLAGFKFTAVAGSCTILVLLRRFYGAQLASWWMCLLCTILILRWTTYNALFLG